MGLLDKMEEYEESLGYFYNFPPDEVELILAGFTWEEVNSIQREYYFEMYADDYVHQEY